MKTRILLKTTKTRLMGYEITVHRRIDQLPEAHQIGAEPEVVAALHTAVKGDIGNLRATPESICEALQAVPGVAWFEIGNGVTGSVVVILDVIYLR